MRGYFPTAGAAGRPQEGSDEPAFAIEHNNGLEAIFVVMGVEQPQLLVAMGGVARAIDI